MVHDRVPHGGSHSGLLVRQVRVPPHVRGVRLLARLRGLVLALRGLGGLLVDRPAGRLLPHHLPDISIGLDRSWKVYKFLVCLRERKEYFVRLVLCDPLLFFRVEDGVFL